MRHTIAQLDSCGQEFIIYIGRVIYIMNSCCGPLVFSTLNYIKELMITKVIAWPFPYRHHWMVSTSIVIMFPYHISDLAKCLWCTFLYVQITLLIYHRHYKDFLEGSYTFRCAWLLAPNEKWHTQNCAIRTITTKGLIIFEECPILALNQIFCWKLSRCWKLILLA